MKTTGRAAVVVPDNVFFFYNREASPNAGTREVWIYDYRTNVHHTLKKKPMRVEDMEDFIASYRPLNRHERVETWGETSNPEGRWRRFTYDPCRAP